MKKSNGQTRTRGNMHIVEKRLPGQTVLNRMIELTEAIARCKRMNIVEMIPDLEAERTQLRKEYVRAV